MTRDDIIRMALEAGFDISKLAREAGFLCEEDWAKHGLQKFERFATFVAAYEREQSAKVVENYCGAWDDQGYALANAIRAREIK
jgi:hypothetical protein